MGESDRTLLDAKSPGAHAALELDDYEDK
jgi:hypothetical protein